MILVLSLPPASLTMIVPLPTLPALWLNRSAFSACPMLTATVEPYQLALLVNNNASSAYQTAIAMA
jgi:hypothetical protein